MHDLNINAIGLLEIQGTNGSNVWEIN